MPRWQRLGMFLLDVNTEICLLNLIWLKENSLQKNFPFLSPLQSFILKKIKISFEPGHF